MVPIRPRAEKSGAGAEAFARYFWQLYNYSYATLDPELLLAISEPACKYCASTAKDVEGIRSRSERIEGAAVQIDAIVAPPSDDYTRAIVAGLIHQDAGRSLRADGTVVQKITPIGKTAIRIALQWKGNGWAVRGVDLPDGKS